jgi:hypothetical protein
MGYFAVPSKLNPNIKELFEVATENIRMFENVGCSFTYEYLLSGFTASNVAGIIQIAEEQNQDIGFKPFNLNLNCNIYQRIEFIKDCLKMYKENEYNGLAILYTIKGEIELAVLQLTEL